MTNVDPNALSAVEAARKIRNGELSSEQLVTACLNQIAKTDDHLKAWAYLDREGALAQAKKCDNHRFRGKPLGPLHGVPVGLKDVIDTSDMPTCRGSIIFQGRQTDQDARIVELLREAGAVILGKTKTTEFAFMHPTDSVNPYNADHTPGGRQPDQRWLFRPVTYPWRLERKQMVRLYAPRPIAGFMDLNQAAD